ncbi:hypothetical protein Misp01_82300 [Microtetraspora sp. NBRC 13810]|uniref:DUF4097 family beta strand repeat-containing protein n=1 Tax=Microtetraspora sp. NBRC 13810 TaxID=3030990 RepID=UPI0024A5B0F3|nr:DUF4097 family beta strand repeat-containing protein [Microtetraspora sp. NBRC 13810]GLW13102.1 hypothetical protein Misp01_82300 [Microtetraspora sp. NBRC 13810]
MPTFDTPEPISVTIAVGLGGIRINAADRADTVVEVRPRDPSDDSDVKAAAETRVEYAAGHLLVKAPKKRSLFSWSGGGSVEVRIDLPAGSRVDADAASDIHGEGRLGDSTFRTSFGEVRLDRTGRLRLHTADGDITVRRSAGHTDVTSANGHISIREIDGPAVVKTANGGITLGEVTGDLRLNTAYGDIVVDRALADVDARNASGGIRVGEIVRGKVVLESAYGDMEIGIRRGTAAWLDLRTPYGTVHNSLDAADGPAPSEETAEVRARTSYGDIVIRRS